MATAFAAPPSGEGPPTRSFQDIWSGRIRFTLGGRPCVLPVLTAGENEAWLEALDGRFAPLIAEVEADEVLTEQQKFETIIDRMTALGTEALLDFLYDYDKHHALPPREELGKSYYPHEVFRAVAEVRLAFDPTVSAGLVALEQEVATEARRLRQRAAQPTQRSSSSRPRTAGRGRTSAKT